MPLEPVYTGSEVSPTGDKSAPPHSLGTVQISADKQQLMGIRVEPVERKSVAHNLRTTARVAADENRLYRLNASTEMWIRRVDPATSGSLVRKNQVLCGYYATNFLTAAQAYLYVIDAADRQRAAKMDTPVQTASMNVQIRQAVETLQNLGVSDTQISEMNRTRTAAALVDVRSPTDGFVLNRTVSLGQWIGPGTELYQIADLSQVWIFADVFENEARYIHPGMTARISAPSRGLNFTAKVSDVPQVFDPATRITRVRLETRNPNLALWPGMFVDTEFSIILPSALSIPVDAVLDSGTRKTVFVDRGNGYFEPRRIETGARLGGRLAVASGLMAGERIVVSGNFLIDSESRFELSAAGMAAPAEKDPVCNMDVNPKNLQALKTQHGGKSYYFCSQHCKKTFEKSPEKYLPKQKDGEKPPRSARAGEAERIPA